MLDEAVQKLPESLRSIIVLHYTGGLSLRETAHAHGHLGRHRQEQTEYRFDTVAEATFMKCDRAIELLATGTVLGRWMARRHAVRCSRCAAEAARLARIADALAAVEPLTPAQRALWSSASTEPRRGEARTPWSRRVRLAATAAVFVLCAALTFVTFRPSPLKTTRHRSLSP